MRLKIKLTESVERRLEGRSEDAFPSADIKL
jgi:hypothetical protein